EITLTAVSATLTLATLGYAGWQLYAARAFAYRAAALEASLLTFLLDEGVTVSTSFWRPFFSYLFTRGLSCAGSATIADYATTYASGHVARVLYAALVNGAVIYVQSNTDGGGEPFLLEDGTDSGFFRVPAGATIDPTAYDVDFSNPMVIPNGGLPDERSICVYQTG